MKTRRVAASIAFAFLVACGSSGPTEPAAPSILIQPLDQIVAPGQAVTFSVRVDGGGLPVTYAWFWNGSPLGTATGPAFTTRPAEVVDNASVFTVVITNSLGSVTSREAILTVSPAPRAPPAGDLRFQGVDGAVARSPYMIADILDLTSFEARGAYGTPLQMSYGSCVETPGGSCSWSFLLAHVPEGSPRGSALYAPGRIDTLESDLNALARPDAVITALDIHDRNGNFAVSRRQLDGAVGFQDRRFQVPAAEVATTVAAEGAAGRVVTALAGHSGGVYLLSYAWTQDRTTTYETTVANPGPADVAAEAGALSDAGYVITAFGKDGTGGYLLVGTRVRGDTIPRPLQVWVGWTSMFGLLDGYAVVGSYWDLQVGADPVTLAQQ